MNISNTENIEYLANMTLATIKCITPKLFWRNDLYIIIDNMPLESLRSKENYVDAGSVLMCASAAIDSGKIELYPDAINQTVAELMQSDNEITDAVQCKHDLIIELVIHETLHMHQYCKFWNYESRKEIGLIEDPVYFELANYIIASYDILQDNLGFDSASNLVCRVMYRALRQSIPKYLDISINTRMRMIRRILKCMYFNDHFGYKYVKYKRMSREFYYGLKLIPDPNVFRSDDLEYIECMVNTYRKNIRNMSYVMVYETLIKDENGNYVVRRVKE